MGTCRLCVFIVLIVISVASQAQDWPLYNAQWTILLHKDVNTTPPPHEPSDLGWFHLHRAHPFLPDALQNTIAPIIINGLSELDTSATGLQLRYKVRDVVVSGWLDPPFRFVLNIDNPALAQLADGVHDLSVDVRGAARSEFKPGRAFVHLSRDKSVGEPFGFDTSVPIIHAIHDRSTSGLFTGPGVVYVSPAEREEKAFPVSREVSPWQLPPHEAPLYQELMGPHTELFHAVQMWWDHPAHPGAPFVRGFTSQHGEDHRRLRVQFEHEKFPMKDGPRGIGWMSPYVGGQVDSQGRLVFAEVGGRVAYLMPDGEIITIAGWRVTPGKDPVWWNKPLGQVRQNMQLRGNWLDGRGEFFTPLDVAIDPQDESIWYVVGYEDNVVWKVELPEDVRNQEATVSVFAGDPDHAAGNVDGIGKAARFNGPASIVFDPVRDVLYVADQDNDSIRRITREGEVSTLFGEPGMQQRLIAQGIDWTDQLAAREVSALELSQAEAQQGARPDIYLPQVVRVDSLGNIVLLEIGFGAVRRINPATGETEILGEVQQKHRQFDRGWAWLDVDRYGNSGPKDGIYWCKFVSTLPDEGFNEAFGWIPPDGGDSVALFPSGTGLYPDGWGRLEQTNAPHYPWLVAVDPRGAVLLAGGGEHGVTRLRVREDNDPDQAQDYWLGRKVWKTGSDSDGSYAGASFALKFGYNGHNYLGFNNAWDFAEASDAQLLDAFEAPQLMRDDPVARQHWLDFIRPNTYSRESTTVVVPPDAPMPTLDLASHRWRQVSLPCDAGANATPARLFGDDGLGAYGADWLMWAFDSASNAYDAVSASTQLAQGNAYWMIQMTGADRQVDMPDSCAATPALSSCLAEGGCFSVALIGDSQSARYQMIGYPFVTGTSVEESYVVTDSGECMQGCAVGTAAANQYLNPNFFSFDGSRYQLITSGETFNAWSGYWALVHPAAANTGARLLFAMPP
ncbi:MAG: hypothetical protein AB8B63_02760 [Granulosicoccus sp.]